jgi:hypothetical protein
MREKQKCERPYVISQDIQLLLRAWGRRNGWRVPQKSFFTNLRSQWQQAMREYVPNLVFVTEDELVEGLQRHDLKYVYPVISLETCYVQTPHRIMLNRTIDPMCEDAGECARPGAPPLVQQLRSLRVPSSTNAVLVDDVIYSGGYLTRLIPVLRRFGINITDVVAGIGIGFGVANIMACGVRVSCVRYFPEVIDQVCERDFYPGIPFSGRTMRGADNTGVPYLLPFGKPDFWSSIPTSQQVEFSRSCLGMAKLLYQDIERLNKKTLRCCDLGRLLPGANPEESTLDILEQWSGML